MDMSGWNKPARIEKIPEGDLYRSSSLPLPGTPEDCAQLAKFAGSYVRRMGTLRRVDLQAWMTRYSMRLYEWMIPWKSTW